MKRVTHRGKFGVLTAVPARCNQALKSLDIDMGSLVEPHLLSEIAYFKVIQIAGINKTNSIIIPVRSVQLSGFFLAVAA